MDSKTKINLLVAAVACLTVTLIVAGVVVVVLVRGHGESQQVIQESAAQSVTDMAAAIRKNTLEAEARAEERKEKEARAKEWSDITAKNAAIMEQAHDDISKMRAGTFKK